MRETFEGNKHFVANQILTEVNRIKYVETDGEIVEKEYLFLEFEAGPDSDFPDSVVRNPDILIKVRIKKIWNPETGSGIFPILNSMYFIYICLDYPYLYKNDEILKI